MEIEISEGKYYPSLNKELTLNGEVTDDILELEVTSNEEDFALEKIVNRECRSDIIFNRLHKGEKISLIVNLLNQSSNIDFSLNKDHGNYSFRIKYLVNGKHIPSPKFELKEIIVSYTNIESFINLNDINNSKYNRDGSGIRFRLKDDMIIHIFAARPLDVADRTNSDRFGSNIYIRFTLDNSISLKDFIDNKIGVFTDLLNFLNNHTPISINSVYGIINDQEESKRCIIKSYAKSVLKHKDFSISCLLNRFSYIENKFETILDKWYSFKQFTLIYALILDHIYKKDSSEIGIFKLTSFLEAFHREIFFTKECSKIYKSREFNINRILYSPEFLTIPFNEKDKKLIKCELEGLKELSLKDRLTELFLPFYKLITVLNPIYSFCEINQLNEIGKTRFLRRVEILNIIREKKENDKTCSKTRDIEYEKIIKRILNDHNLTKQFLDFSYEVTLNIFTTRIKNYRNTMMHGKQDYEKITKDQIYYMVKILEFICSILIINKIFGYRADEIDEIFELRNANRVERIIKSNIYEYCIDQ